jgi:hypothetical protein
MLLEENDYEADGSTKNPKSNGPFKGRMNASCQYAKLFEDVKVFLHGEFTVFDKEDFGKLVELTGAKVLKREPKLERLDELITLEMPHHLDRQFSEDFACSNFIIFDVTKVKEVRHKYLYTVRASWLFACIDEFKIIHPNSYNKL